MSKDFGEKEKFRKGCQKGVVARGGSPSSKKTILKKINPKRTKGRKKRSCRWVECGGKEKIIG